MQILIRNCKVNKWEDRQKLKMDVSFSAFGLQRKRKASQFCFVKQDACNTGSYRKNGRIEKEIRNV